MKTFHIITQSLQCLLLLILVVFVWKTGTHMSQVQRDVGRASSYVIEASRKVDDRDYERSYRIEKLLNKADKKLDGCKFPNF